MSFDRSALLHLLPCRLCGDLPDEIVAQVDAALAEDAELRSMYEELELSRDQCAQLLDSAMEAVPGLAELGVGAPAAAPAPSGPAVPPTRLRGLWLGLAAALLLAVGAAASTPAVPCARYFSAHAAAAQAAASTAPELVRGAGPALRAALLAAGVEPRLAMAPDLSDQGFTLVGVLPLGTPHGGVAVVYEKDGKHYVCQIFGAGPAPGQPDAVEAVGGLLLRGYEDGPRSAVSWTGGGRMCVFSGEAPLGDLFAVVRRRVRSGA